MRILINTTNLKEKIHDFFEKYEVLISYSFSRWGEEIRGIKNTKNLNQKEKPLNGLINK